MTLTQTNRRMRRNREQQQEQEQKKKSVNPGERFPNQERRIIPSHPRTLTPVSKDNNLKYQMIKNSQGALPSQTADTKIFRRRQNKVNSKDINSHSV